MSNLNFREVLGQVIREYRTDELMTLRTLAQKSNVALGYLSEVERGHKEASSEILEQIALGLDIPLYQIIVEAGYRLQEWNTPDDILDKSIALA